MKRTHKTTDIEFSTEMLLDEEFDDISEEELPHYEFGSAEEFQLLAY